MEAFRGGGDRVVGHGQEDEIGLVEDVGRVGEGARAGNERPEAISSGDVPAGDSADVPASSAECDRQCRANPARADECDARLAVVSVLVVVRLVVVVPVVGQICPFFARRAAALCYA
jgi:hypothetical protein